MINLSLKENEKNNLVYCHELGWLHCKKNDDLSFLDIVQQDGEDYGYSDFISKVDTVFLGRKTYDWVMNQVSEFPHKDKDTYIITSIITRSPKPSIGNIKSVN